MTRTFCSEITTLVENVIRSLTTYPMTDTTPADQDCLHCVGLRQRFKIRSPGELEKAIRVVRDNVSDGTIIEIPSRSGHASIPFSALNSKGPWDDVVGYAFRCASCGQLFYLSAETYHGSGGEWSPVSSIESEM